MDKMKKIGIIVVLALAVIIGLVGCANQRLEKQEFYRTEGITYLEKGDYKNAIESFQSALDQSLGEIGEKEVDICFYKAEAMYLSGDKEGALGVYTSIIEHNEDAKAYYLRGNLYYALGKEGNALKDYESAVEKDRDNYDLYVAIYEVLSANGKTKDAKNHLKEALEISGSSAYDKMQKGRIQFLLGETEKAEALLIEAAEKGETESFYYLAEIATDDNDLEAAKDYVEKYTKGGNATSFHLFNIGNAQLKKGNYEFAIKCLESALALERVPNRQVVMRTLVAAYEYNQDFEAAKTLITEYVKLYPDDKEAEREYTFLFTR